MSWQHSSKWLLDLGWLGFLLILFNHFWQARRSLAQAKHWQVTTARLVHCEWTKVGRSLWPKIAYIYQVNERDWVGEYLFLDTAHNNPNSKYSRSIAYKVALAFKENRTIDIYYNPDNPEQSAIDIKIPTKLNGILILIGFFIILHVFVIVRHFFINT